MKFHIVKENETIDTIKTIYKMDDSEFLNINRLSSKNKLEVGQKVRVIDHNKYVTDTINSINEVINKDEEVQTEVKKYVCPHCKNIIIIPK